MKKLTKSQRKELLNELHRENVRRYADRIRVILLSDQGWTVAKIAEALFLDRSTVFRYRTSYESGGLEQLVHDTYVGRKAILSQSEQDKLINVLEEERFLSSKDIAAYILNEFGVNYSVNGVTALLHRLGFSYKKPDPKPAKADATAQKEFQRRLAIIRSKMLKNDYLYFSDACHPQLNSMPQYGWFKKGEKTFNLSLASRSRVNLLGALDIDSQCTIIRSFDTINEFSVINFIDVLEKRHTEARRITLVADNASYFKSKLVKERLKNSKVRIIHLPPYSPNLNPIERLWKFLHKKVLYNIFHDKPNDFKISIEKFCRYLRFSWGELESLLTYNCQSFI